MNAVEIEQLLARFPEMLTVREVAGILRVHPRSIQRWARDGHFAALRIGRSYRIPLLECWLPLAQELCVAAGWADDAPTLETLVLVAAPALAQARSSLEARAILSTCHALLEHDRP